MKMHSKHVSDVIVRKFLSNWNKSLRNRFITMLPNGDIKILSSFLYFLVESGIIRCTDETKMMFNEHFKEEK